MPGLCLRQYISDHPITGQVPQLSHFLLDEVAQEGSGSHNVFSLLERNRVDRHIDCRFRIRVDYRRAARTDVQVNEQVTKEDHVSSREHSAKVLCLGAGQRNGLSPQSRYSGGLAYVGALGECRQGAGGDRREGAHCPQW